MNEQTVGWTILGAGSATTVIMAIVLSFCSQIEPPTTYTERVVVYPDGDCPCEPRCKCCSCRDKVFEERK